MFQIPVLTDLQLKLAKVGAVVAFAILSYGGTYFYGVHKGAGKCVAAINTATVKQLDKVNKEQQVVAQKAVERADKVSKQLNVLKEKQNEEPIVSGCTLSNDVQLQRLQTIAGRTGSKP